MSEFDFADVLTRMVEVRASDVHLTPGFAPAIRVRGRIAPMEDYPPLTPQETRDVVYAILNNDQRKRFENEQQLDFAYSIPGVARFRVNCYFQRGSVSAAFRHIPQEIKTLEELELPADARTSFTPQAARLRAGHRADRLGQDDDPRGDDRPDQPRARGAHPHDRGPDRVHAPPPEAASSTSARSAPTRSDFAQALKAALRQDPDVILVGEMRDLETISTALTAAETGHLVFATLHTQSTAQTVDRIIDVFPAEQQGQVRMQLSIALQGIVTQQLLPTADGSGRVCACEVLVPTPAIRNLIREGKTHQIYSAIQTSGATGMQTMDAHLAQLVRAGQDHQQARRGSAPRCPRSSPPARHRTHERRGPGVRIGSGQLGSPL